MDKIAFFADGVFVYWQSIILTMAAATAICFFLGFYLYKTGNAAGGFAALPIALVLSLFFGRFFHWYCRTDSYVSFLSAITDHSSGEYALMGVFLGCFLTAVILYAVSLHKSMGDMLDAMSLAGCAGIAVGRLASLFNTADRGQVLANFKNLPWASPVTNAVSGAVEYRLATFMIQAMVALVLFIALTVFYFKDGKKRSGDTTIIFLMCYGCTQVVLDSTRYDSLFFRSNGFVSIVQVLGAVALAIAIGVFSTRMVKKQGFRWIYVPIWVGMAAAIGVAGFMEYYVQRHGSTAVFSYSVMSAGLMVAVGLTLLTRMLADKPQKKTAKVNKTKR